MAHTLCFAIRNPEGLQQTYFRSEKRQNQRLIDPANLN
jgi:hypothetical protein